MSNNLFRTSIMLPNGKRKWIRSKSKEGLEQKKKEIQLQIGAGLDILDNSTFGEYAEVWFNVYKKPYLRRNSADALRNALDNHIFPYLRDVPLKKVSPMQIQMVVSSLTGKSKSLNDKVIQILRGVFNAAVDNNLIAKSPVPAKIKSKGVRTKEKTALTADQSKRLLDAVSGTRAYLFCLIALQTGMRRGEICGLMWEDVDLDKQIIHVRHNAVFTSSQTVVSEALKTSAAVRDIPIPPTLLDTLKGLKSSAEALSSCTWKTASLCRKAASPICGTWYGEEQLIIRRNLAPKPPIPRWCEVLISTSRLTCCGTPTSHDCLKAGWTSKRFSTSRGIQRWI